MSLFETEPEVRLNSTKLDERVVFIHTLGGDLQFVLSTKHISPLSLWVRRSLAEQPGELCGRNDLAEPSRRPLEIIPVEMSQCPTRNGKTGGTLPYRLQLVFAGAPSAGCDKASVVGLD